METDTDLILVKLKTDALRLLTFRPRSVDELKKKLASKKYPADLVDQTIETLKRQGLMDDEKFAKVYAGSKMYTRPSGRRELERDLRQKGVAENVVKKTLSEFQDFDEIKSATDLVRTRYEKMGELEPKKRKARIYGFLKRRSFNDDVIFKVLDDLSNSS